MAKKYWVDIPQAPNPHGENYWKSVAEFDTMEEAIAFTQEHFGADDQGRVSLITVGENDEPDLVYCPACEQDVICDGPNQTSMDDHGRCQECQWEWQVGLLGEQQEEA